MSSRDRSEPASEGLYEPVGGADEKASSRDRSEPASEGLYEPVGGADEKASSSDWRLPDEGALFVVTGASGSGKTTLVTEALARLPGLSFSVSATTRAPRTGERDGVDYHFVSRERFAQMVDERALLEHAEVYGNRYGTPRAPVQAALARGTSIVLDIDLQGARQVRASHPDCASIFILPPDLAEMERRLRGRGTDSDEVIAGRMSQAMEQISGCGEFDYVVINDDLATAHRDFQAILIAELSRTRRRRDFLSGWLRPGVR